MIACENGSTRDDEANINCDSDPAAFKDKEANYSKDTIAYRMGSFNHDEEEEEDDCNSFDEPVDPRVQVGVC